MRQNQRRENSLPHKMPSVIYIGMLPRSPIGPMWVAVSVLGLLMVEWDMPQADFSHLVQARFHAGIVFDPGRTSVPLQQLASYLDGNLRQFSLALDMSGMTSFQQRVLDLTARIPYGQTATYKELAVQSGRPNAARAVGRVEATNPMPLVIPCHRVLGSDGSLHGYGGPGGIKMKAWLLQLEQGLK